MASIGLTKTQGANSGDPLTVAWKQAVQGQLQSDEDRLEALRELHEGVAAGVGAALLWPARIVCASAAVGAVSLAVMAAFYIARALQ